MFKKKKKEEEAPVVDANGQVPVTPVGVQNVYDPTLANNVTNMNPAQNSVPDYSNQAPNAAFTNGFSAITQTPAPTVSPLDSMPNGFMDIAVSLEGTNDPKPEQAPVVNSADGFSSGMMPENQITNQQAFQTGADYQAPQDSQAEQNVQNQQAFQTNPAETGYTDTTNNMNQYQQDMNTIQNNMNTVVDNTNPEVVQNISTEEQINNSTDIVPAIEETAAIIDNPIPAKSEEENMNVDLSSVVGSTENQEVTNTEPQSEPTNVEETNNNNFEWGDNPFKDDNQIEEVTNAVSEETNVVENTDETPTEAPVEETPTEVEQTEEETNKEITGIKVEEEESDIFVQPEDKSSLDEVLNNIVEGNLKNTSNEEASTEEETEDPVEIDIEEVEDVNNKPIIVEEKEDIEESEETSEDEVKEIKEEQEDEEDKDDEEESDNTTEEEPIEEPVLIEDESDDIFSLPRIGDEVYPDIFKQPTIKEEEETDDDEEEDEKITGPVLNDETPFSIFDLPPLTPVKEEQKENKEIIGVIDDEEEIKDEDLKEEDELEQEEQEEPIEENSEEIEEETEEQKTEDDSIDIADIYKKLDFKNEKIRFCENCGAMILGNDATVCPSCGEPL